MQFGGEANETWALPAQRENVCCCINGDDGVQAAVPKMEKWKVEFQTWRTSVRCRFHGEIHATK